MKLWRLPFIRAAVNLAERERRRIIAEMVQVRGLMPLLMKPRNGEKWSAEDRRELVTHLHRISALGPYVFLLVMPGGLAVLPALAWWLDRRRRPRPSGEAPSTIFAESQSVDAKPAAAPPARKKTRDDGLGGKYPPAKPGALLCEPLKAAERAANAARPN
ncbi:MAG: hypothetical protein ACREVR_11410 [Burkholderiales bacterium]